GPVGRRKFPAWPSRDRSRGTLMLLLLWFSTAEGMHVHREGLQGRVVELAAPCRHHAAPAVDDAFYDGFLVRRVEPDIVGEVWRAELAVALAVRPVTGGAIVGKDLCAARQVCARVGLQPRQRTDIIGDGGNLVGLEQVVAAK